MWRQKASLKSIFDSSILFYLPTSFPMLANALVSQVAHLQSSFRDYIGNHYQGKVSILLTIAWLQPKCSRSSESSAIAVGKLFALFEMDSTHLNSAMLPGYKWRLFCYYILLKEMEMTSFHKGLRFDWALVDQRWFLTPVGASRWTCYSY